MTGFFTPRILISILPIFLGAANLSPNTSETKLITPVLSGSVTSHEMEINLTEEGSLDWFFCSFSGNGATYQKDTVSLLSGYKLLNVDRYDWFSNALSTFKWNNGKPIKSGSKTEGHYISGLVGRGLTMEVPADTAMRVLKIYLGAYEAKGKITAQLEGTSAPIYVGSITASQGGVPVEKLCTLKFQSDSVGRKLLIKYEIERGYYQNFGSTDPKAITGNVSLSAVCLAEDQTTTALSVLFENKNDLDFKIFPNPLKQESMLIVNYSLSHASMVNIDFYSILGKKIKSWKYENPVSGNYQLRFSSNELMLEPGIYIAKLSANGQCKTLKLNILK